jgi:O-antigen ligase
MVIEILLPIFSVRYPNVILLSLIQFIKIATLIFIPVLNNYKKLDSDNCNILSAFTIFQFIWVILQRMKGGYLGKDLELHYEVGSIIAEENRSFMRSTGTFIDPNVLSSFMFICFVLFLGAILENKKINFQHILVLILSILIIIFTGSRAIYLSTLLFSGFILIRQFNIHLKIKSLMKYLIIPGIISLILIYITIPIFQDRINSFSTLFRPKGSGSYRLWLISHSFELGNNSLIGVGLNLSAYSIAANFTQGRYNFDPALPYNLFAQIYAETGIMNIILFLGLIYFVIRIYITSKNIESRKYVFAVFAYLLAAQVYNLFLNQNEVISLCFLALGFIVSKGRDLSLKNSKLR